MRQKSTTQIVAERSMERTYTIEQRRELKEIVEATQNFNNSELAVKLNQLQRPCFNGSKTWGERQVSNLRISYGIYKHKNYTPKNVKRRKNIREFVRTVETNPSPLKEQLPLARKDTEETEKILAQILKMDIAANRKIAMIKCLI